MVLARTLLFRSPLMRRASIVRVVTRHARQLHRTAVVTLPEIPFKLADIGEGIAEVEVLQWFVKEGEPVKQFQNVCEVQSDKATVEITSRYDGIVTKVHYNVGEMAKVGHTLIDIEVDEATAASHQGNSKPAQPRKTVPKPVEAAAAPTPKSTATTVDVTSAPPVIAEVPRPTTINLITRSNGEKVLTSPSVRRLAQEHNIDLLDVEGSGRQGRILKEDLLEYITVLAATPPPPPSTTVSSTTTHANASTSRIATYLTSDQVVPLTAIQKMMVKSMNAALKIPHFGYADEVEMDALHVLREQLKPVALTRGLKLSYMPFMIKAASLALKCYPTLNASVGEDSTHVTYHAAHNISVAMDTPTGLLVPNIKNVEQKSILEIAEELNRLQQLASAGKLTISDLSGGTFSISNIGSIGGTYMSPVILVPQVAIGAVGKIQILPRFALDGSVVPVRMMCVSWSGDHRVIDGATMARFSNTWKAYLETPTSMLAEMS